MKPDPAEVEAARKLAAQAAAQAAEEISGGDADNDGKSGKRLMDFFHTDNRNAPKRSATSTSGAGLLDDDGESGRTREDFIAHMTDRREQDEQSEQAPHSSESPPPELYCS